MAENILADIPKEGENPFEDNEEKETPADSPTETKPEEEKPSQEGEKESSEEKKPEDSNTPEEQIPFHKHPRWKEIYSKNQELEQKVAELSRFKEEISPKLQELEEKKQPIPNWFADTFGEDEAKWEAFQTYDRQRREEIKDEIYSENEEYYRNQQEQTKKWSDWTTNQLQDLKDEGLKFEENELLKVLVDYKPVDDQGNLNFHKGYEILLKGKAADEVEKSRKTEQKKKIASQSMAEGSGESQRNYKTSKDLRNKDWSDLAV